MEYFDEATKTRYIPHVIEPSVGVDRLFLALLCSAYEQDEIDGEPRTVLKLHPRIAPIKAAVFPLVKNKPELFAMAHQLCSRLKRRWNVFFDAAGAIGRRYRRMDEVGTAFCITVDFDSLSNNTFTLRDRDSTKQVRMTEAEIIDAVGERC
jgi:glycyl-tRNA synthetase